VVKRAPKPDYLAILRTLTEHEVEFIIVGGVCAVLHGAPIATFDLDVVHSRDPENVRHLLTALESLDACARGQGARKIAPNESHLASPGHQLLMTRFGPLDLLGAVGSGQMYEDLVPSTIELPVGGRLKVRVLDLETLIRLKEEAGRDKDRAVLPILRRTLEEKSRS